ncbi:MAG: tetratricopeptide repeat protein [Lachnospiraceae bacterium]|nr:tetratricopeptide repeat protein [Lachnospiraceae bacterium]
MNNSPYDKLTKISNRLYNEGLKKARARDLSGAVESLKRSLLYKKCNTEARNLLGLVYYEQGETVKALTEWVISKNFDNYENDADYFLERIQDDQNELSRVNSAVRKYNLGLEAARLGNYDTAIIQLKKAVGIFPRYLRAMKLLGLLYIRQEEYQKAKKVLVEARAIDHSDTQVLLYLSEVEKNIVPDNPRNVFFQTQSPAETEFDEEMGIEHSKKGFLSVFFNENKPSLMLFLNLIFGVLIGIAVVYYLIVPSKEAQIREEYNAGKVDYSSELSAKTAAISQQEKEITALRQQVTDLKSQLNGITYDTIEIAVGDETFSSFFDAWSSYNDLKSREYSDEELVALSLDLWTLDLKGIRSKYAQDILSKMREDIYPLAAKLVYKQGKQFLDEGQLEEAIKALNAASDFDPESDAALYYLGKAYEENKQYNEAIFYYRHMLTVAPNSTLRDYIPHRLEACEEGIKALEEEKNKEADTQATEDGETE